MPNISQLLQKAIEAYQDFIIGKRIRKYAFDQASSYIDHEYDSPIRLPSLKKMKNRKFSPIERQSPGLMSTRVRQQPDLLNFNKHYHTRNHSKESKNTI